MWSDPQSSISQNPSCYKSWVQRIENLFAVSKEESHIIITHYSLHDALSNQTYELTEDSSRVIWSLALRSSFKTLWSWCCKVWRSSFSFSDSLADSLTCRNKDGRFIHSFTQAVADDDGDDVNTCCSRRVSLFCSSCCFISDVCSTFTFQNIYINKGTWKFKLEFYFWVIFNFNWQTVRKGQERTGCRGRNGTRCRVGTRTLVAKVSAHCPLHQQTFPLSITSVSCKHSLNQTPFP